MRFQGQTPAHIPLLLRSLRSPVGRYRWLLGALSAQGMGMGSAAPVLKGHLGHTRVYLWDVFHLTQ